MPRRHPRVVALALIARPGTHEILVSNGHDRRSGARFQRLFGGGVEFGEHGEEALRREIGEELGLELGGVRFAGVVENLFVFEGRARHEILLVYQTEFADRAVYRQSTFTGVEHGEAKTGEWRDLDDPSPALPLYPEQLMAQIDYRPG